ncbi:VOC family protein [Dactylosporangium sp. NBC_01737]|uniref:VOC family protein n=1 Tax=Dactylosporangium sp. NBC_01737 TaxID=2975959 RepID=UPI002E153369|nr:VOC family protein [Dactylosporangium sp. NBC_01737]
MSVVWGIAVDCRDAGRLAAFWREALGYVDAPVPEGFASREEWLVRWEVPPEEWNDSAYLVDPEGAGPSLSFLKVPEPKVVKNRLHIDIKAGGRDQPQDVRWPRVTETVQRLLRAGASVVEEYSVGGVPDHVTMADPEGNEFCVV